MSESRTKKSIKNSIVALGIFFLNLLLQFFFRKVFLDHLGASVLGLNTTATNLLQFLNLAELGIGLAVASTLYKPLFDKDTKTINEIVSLQGWLYRNIAIFLIVGSGVLMLFFPKIFSKIDIPLWYAYATYSVLLFSALLGYFANYKQIILSASQQEYKIQLSYRLPLLIKVLTEIFALKYLSNGYVWWLIIEVAFAIIASISLGCTIKHSFPNLKTKVSLGKTLKSKYPDVSTKIKQVFFHKIGAFALTQASPLIIYAYTTLSTIAIYGNYFLITNGIAMLVSSVFNSMGAGIGNLIAQGDKIRILKVFDEIFTLRFSLASILCAALILFGQIFVTLWVGSQYLFELKTLILMTMICYVAMTRNTVDSYLNGYGLFKDIWSPLTEAVINISLSVILGHEYGINGVLTGIIISQILIILIWKPYFLFHYGFQISIRPYIILNTKCIIPMIISGTIAYLCGWAIGYSLYEASTVNILKGIVVFLIYICISISLLFILTNGMKDGVKRIKRLIINK